MFIQVKDWKNEGQDVALHQLHALSPFFNP